MDSGTSVGRRTLIGATLATAAVVATTGCAEAKPARSTVVMRDRLWIWGHGRRTLDGNFKLPAGGAMGQAAAAKNLGVNNLAVIRWSAKPAPPFGTFIDTLDDLGGVGWSVVDNASEPTRDKIDTALRIADTTPNLTTLWLDDLFILPMKITPAELDYLRVKAHNRAKPLDLAAVVYVTQIYDTALDLTPLDKVDVVSLWAWDAVDIDRMPEHVAAFRERFPDKRLMLGVYMWDFGASAPVGRDRMQRQLDLALDWMRSGEIEGVVFHSTPLVGRQIREVEMAKRWIRKYGDTRVA